MKIILVGSIAVASSACATNKNIYSDENIKGQNYTTIYGYSPNIFLNVITLGLSSGDTASTYIAEIDGIPAEMGVNKKYKIRSGSRKIGVHVRGAYIKWLTNI